MTRLLKPFTCLSLMVFAFLAMPLPAQAATPLLTDSAFTFTISPIDATHLKANWSIAPSYYLYRERFSFKVVSPESFKIGETVLPPGIPKEDNILGKYEVYKNQLSVVIPIEPIKPGAAKDSELNSTQPSLLLAIGYQGCSVSGFCYPPPI